jgi:hypothetical protein
MNGLRRKDDETGLYRSYPKKQTIRVPNITGIAPFLH